MMYQRALTSVVKLSVKKPNHFELIPECWTFERPLSRLTILEVSPHRDDQQPFEIFTCGSWSIRLMAVLPLSNLVYLEPLGKDTMLLAGEGAPEEAV